MASHPNDQAKKKPGRPRSESARKAILKAAADILEEAGPGRVTVEAVAARAKVGKPTIYRYWPNAQALAMAAVMAQPLRSSGSSAPSSAALGAPLAALRAQVRGVAATFNTRRGRQAAQLMASAESDSELAKAFRNQVVLASREEGRGILARAVEDGTLPETLDAEIALDLIYGPLFYRLLAGHAPLDEAFAGAVVDLALSGLTRAAR